MLSQCTLFALGIMPYITASIMMQMLSMTVPSLEAIAERRRIWPKNNQSIYSIFNLCGELLFKVLGLPYS